MNPIGFGPWLRAEGQVNVVRKFISSIHGRLIVTLNLDGSRVVHFECDQDRAEFGSVAPMVETPKGTLVVPRMPVP